MKYKLLIMVFLGGILCAHAQPGSIETITVRDALRIALEKSPDIRVAQKNVEIARAAKKGAGMPAPPDVTYMKEGIEAGDFAEERFSVSQRFDFPLQSVYERNSGKEAVRVSEFELEVAQKELISRVKTAYAELAYSLEMIRLREKELEIAESLYNAVNTKFELGEASELDLLKSEIFYKSAQNKLNDDNIRMHTSRYVLFTIIGLEPNQQTYEIVFPDSLTFPEIEIIQNDVLAFIPQTPQYKAAESMQNATKQSLNAARMSYMPDFSLSWYKQNYMDGFKPYGFEIGISVPLWFFGEQSAKVSRAKAEHSISADKIFGKYLEIKREVELSWHGYDESRKKIEIFNRDIRPKSEKLRELTQIAYREGQIGILEFLDSERTSVENEIRYFDELLNYYIDLITLEKYIDYEVIFNN